MKRNFVLLIVCLLFIPSLASAQGIADGINSLQAVLDKLKSDMIPMCGDLIGVGRAIAGMGATFYIGHRVWKHIANGESVDVYPLLRPFVLGWCILNFPVVISIMDGILSPTVIGTKQVKDKSDLAIKELFKKKEEMMKRSDQWQALVGEGGSGDRDLWMKYAHKDVQTEDWKEKIMHNMEFVASKLAYRMQNSIKQIISVILQILYAAAALCINTLRTFNLIVLAVLGPIVFGLSVFDGFHHTLTVYLSRYVNVYLWLPVCNILAAILGKIQENILKLDLESLTRDGTTVFGLYDTGYIIFLIIGIIAYTTVPNIAEWIVHVGGGNALQHKVTRIAGNTVNTATTAATQSVGMASNYMQSKIAG
ncbi:conjugative transposon protein TraJ [Chitinophaga eiseniae]|uniref:Conjugative transposon protein TraJ n=1 Tax=Chitinophaga eiseniae TaxID=634771 RepID=A0A847SG95_9BACT|nr:conjugative transposon protein TraJ [Chitinophaga eiseniae]NLR78025.1 conjugative transposon protein TraJ [Chitinophaga eiseniae]